MTRISRDEMLMRMAEAAALRSTCRRRQIGALLAIDGRPLSAGYGGAPPGVEHCNEENCLPTRPCSRTIHAEANAILFAARKGVAIEGATLYTTVSPCYECAKMVLAGGVTRVVYRHQYRDILPIEYLEDHGVPTIALP